MPSSWNVYYVVFLSAGMALAIPGFLALVSALVSRASKTGPPSVRWELFEEAPLKSQVRLGKRMNARFFLGMNVALVLVSCALLLIPIIGVFKSGENPTIGIRASLTVLSVCTFASLGLFYAVRKGDIAWLTSFRTPRTPKDGA